jgi:hypothetical protein
VSIFTPPRIAKLILEPRIFTIGVSWIDYFTLKELLMLNSKPLQGTIDFQLHLLIMTFMIKLAKFNHLIVKEIL